MMIQLPDTRDSDPSGVSFWDFEAQPAYLANGFVVIECAISNAKYLGQINAPHLNLNRDALAPTDPTSMNQLEAIQAGRFNRDVAIKEAFLFNVKLLREINPDGSVRSIRRRPQIGAQCRAATADELLRYLSLPNPVTDDCIIGRLAETDIPIAIDAKTLFHHLLVSGTTGSGKSNTIGSVITTALTLGAAVVIYDMKPDFQSLHEPNDEMPELYYRGIDTVSYWRIGTSRLGGDRRNGRYQENPIQIIASELDGSLLARSIFRPHEGAQADTFEFLWDMHAEEKSGTSFTLDEFVNWLPDPPEAKRQFDINTSNYTAMRSKLRRPTRRLSWIDNLPGAFAKTLSGLSVFDLADLLSPGSVTVIRIASDAGGGRGYALFLNYVFQQIYRLKETGRVGCPIINILDEAQELFPRGGGSSAFQDIVGSTLGSHIRRGRSLGIGTVVAVQSADRVPIEIMDNLNSRIVLHHTQLESVRTALPGATSEQAAMALTFGSGEALVDIFGSNAMVHCQMRRSPFKLTKFGL